MLAESHIKLIESVVSDNTDLLLLYMAIVSMKISGHRYGAFLDAASTAAKLAVYMTYLEQGRNQRKTGFIHHVETKRVKAIVQEVEAALMQGKELKMLGSREPQYLIGVPHLWLEKYPQTSDSRASIAGLSEKDQRYLNVVLPDDVPEALIISEAEFIDVVVSMHDHCQSQLDKADRLPLSEAMTEHIKFCLIHSETVLEVKLLDHNLPLYALLRNSYSPKNYTSRVETMFRDTLRFFQIMRLWTQRDPKAFRAIETLCVAPEQYDEAIAELDEFLTSWADKYHVNGEDMKVLQLVVGPGTEDLNR